VLLFDWFYGQFVHRLYFAMDDYIEANVNLARPATAVITDCLVGRLNWSGYRPGTCAMRVVVSHLFGADYAFMHYVINLGVHLLNTLLVFHIAQFFFRKRAEWSFLAAAIFLLLPSHNEAVFWYSGNSNLIALCFALISLWAILHADQQRRWLLWSIAWLAYLLAVLVYEVMLPLPLLLWLTEWVINKKPLQRYQFLLYGVFFIASCLLLGLRMWAMNGQLNVASNFYSISFAPDHILHNYILLLGQIVLLHTSPWVHIPLYLNIREWLSPWSPTALLSIFVAALCAMIWLVYSWRQQVKIERRPLLLAFVWGLLWLLLISLPFVLLVGRNPENRYVYIPSVGFSLAVSALFALLAQSVQRIPPLRALILGLAVTLLSFYGYVTASDAQEWVQAGRHARGFLSQTQTLLPDLPKGSRVFQIGLPTNIGTAYVFMIEDALRGALRWFYDDQSLKVAMGEEKLRDYLQSDHVNLAETYLLYYDQATYTTRLIDWVSRCQKESGCTYYPLASFQPTPQPEQQIDFHGEIQLVDQRLSSLFPLGHWYPTPALATCWMIGSPSTAERLATDDLTLFVHFTDATGETTLTQADHKLQQAYPFAPQRTLTSQWPRQQPICDLTVPDPQEWTASADTPISIRGGLWVPETDTHLTPTTVTGYDIDQYGRIIFSQLP